MNGDVHCICFRQEIPFWDKFGPKNEKFSVSAEIWYLA